MRAVAVLLGTVIVLVVATGWGGSDVTVAVSDFAALGAAGFAAVTAWRARRRTGRRAWAWFAAGLGLWAVGEALWTVWEVILGDDVPYPSVADVAYLAAVPFALVGLAGFGAARGGRFGARSALDGCIVATCILFVGWDLALGPAVRAADEPFVSHAVSIAYPLSDVVLATLAIVVLQWGSSGARRPLLLVAAGSVVMAVADTAFTWMIADGTYTGDGLVPLLWPASYLLLAAAAGADRAPVPAGGEGASTTGSAGSILLPYVPLTGAAGIALVHAATGSSVGPFLTILGAVIVVLVLARQAILASELRTTVGALADREEELRRLAMTDALTGLANRAQFGTRLEAAVAQAGTRPAVVYVDLDGFKGVNDRYGHAVGDRLLVAAADRLRAAATATMLVARLGGDEFVVLVHDGHGEAVAMAQRILDSFVEPFEVEGEHVAFAASVGVASAPVDGSPDEAVRRADAAMYVAKTTGKARAVDYPDETIVAA